MLIERSACVIMSSDLYGSETFKYDNLKEAYEGLVRIANRCMELNDCVEREFSVQLMEEN